MRGIDTTIKRLRKMVFTEVAKLAYSGQSINNIEEIPYIICPGDFPTYRNSVHLERAIASERVRLALGLSLRPENKPVHITRGAEESNIAEKYYEPPLMQVIPSACDACQDNMYEVSDMCRGCVAHPCTEVCPKGATSIVDGKSVIDQEKCIKCGRCKDACPYSAIIHKTRPCAAACGVGAITSDAHGRAQIDPDKCVSCGMCMVSCPFGAIADKSQIFQLIRAMQQPESEIIAILAPAFAGQFGTNVSAGKVKSALLQIGFSDVVEVAIGADLGAVTEAHHYVEKVATGELPFLLTSCCPAWSMLAKKQFPQMIDSVSNALTPMVATARIVKKDHPNAKIVFVGPCAAKKLEASRRTVRSDVDFVITFEELDAMFAAREIDFSILPEEEVEDATAAGRGYGAAGGVADAIEKCINEYYPGTEVKIAHCEGLSECKKTLMMAKAGKMKGFLIEGMGCPGGCIAGAGTNIAIPKASTELKKFSQSAKEKLPKEELLERTDI